jgi:alcohol-forming fatty acyl-CoA reductase
MPLFTNFSPNSYTYTKALSEQICESYKNQIPITIVRPSIVTGSEKEPIVGWCDNFNGPVGLLTACGIGIMRTMYASASAELNCVAVDVVSKTLIVAAWKCAIDNEKIDNGKEPNEILNDRQLPIYNCASLHNMNLQLLVYDGQYLIRRYPFERFVWLPGGGVTLCRVMNYFRVEYFFFHSKRLDDVKPTRENRGFWKIRMKIAIYVPRSNY